MYYMTPKKFLVSLGWILLVLGIIGFLFPDIIVAYAHFEPVENWAHILLAIVALAVGYGIKDHATQKWLAVLYGLVALVFGVWGFLVTGNPTLTPLDNIVHLIIGAWGLWAGFSKRV